MIHHEDRGHIIPLKMTKNGVLSIHDLFEKKGSYFKNNGSFRVGPRSDFEFFEKTQFDKMDDIISPEAR